MTDLTGKTVLVTGASRGIGEAAARHMAALGAAVLLAARSTSDIMRIASEIRDAGGHADAIICDVSHYGDLDAAVTRAGERFGGLDILVNNAGVIEPISRLEGSDPEGWDRAIDINLKGVYHGIRAALPAMRARGGGTIVTISSGAAHGPMEGWSHYCASKAGVHMLTRCVDRELRGEGIRAIGLSPGTVATGMQREIKASGINRVSQLDWSDHIPPEWPARCIAWLCGPAGDEYRGEEVSLRDEDIRRKVGLIE